MADVQHDVPSQNAAIDHGKMDGFNKIDGCSYSYQFRCYVQYKSQAEEPNIWALATAFTINDRMFEMRRSPSWAGHMEIVSATQDGFRGNNPIGGITSGWGCDSADTTQWSATGRGPWTTVPSCVPTATGSGAFEPTPVQDVSTLMDQFTQAGLSWRIYGGGGALQPGQDGKAAGYLWTICPTYADCLDSSQAQDFVPADQVLTDAANGTLPAWSVVTPTWANSDHNTASHLQADNWIGQVVGAIESGPDWSSTAIFLTWDDCGCFYDHVDPIPYNKFIGIRVPMIVISPYAKPGYTDSTPETYASVIAYVDQTFGLPALNSVVAKSDPFSNAFDYSQTPLPPIPMVHSTIPAASRRYIATHPATSDGT